MKISSWPPSRLGVYKKIECILGPTRASYDPFRISMTDGYRKSVVNFNQSNKKLTETKSITPDDANRLDKQAEDDITSYELFFAALAKWTHPVNIELLQPFHELLTLATLVKANCPVMDDLEAMPPADTGSGNSPIELLRAQAQKVVDESNKVAQDFNKMTLSLNDATGKIARDSAQALVHLKELQSGITSLQGLLTSTQDQLKDVNKDVDKYKSDLEEKKKELAKKSAELESIEKAIEGMEYYQDNAAADDDGFGGGDIGGSILLNGKYALKQSVQASVNSLRTVMTPIRNNLDSVTSQKEKLDDLVSKTTELKKRLDARVAGAEKLRKDSEEWNVTIRMLDTKYSVVNSHIGTVAKSTDTLNNDLRAFIPSRAIYSKHILSVVDYGSMFANRPGLYDELKKICAELRKANDLENGNVPGDQRASDTDFLQLKDRLEREEEHLASIGRKLASGHSQDEEMPKALDFAKDPDWWIEAGQF